MFSIFYFFNLEYTIKKGAQCSELRHQISVMFVKSWYTRFILIGSQCYAPKMYVFSFCVLEFTVEKRTMVSHAISLMSKPGHWVMPVDVNVAASLYILFKHVD
jgi:hypothetical protein